MRRLLKLAVYALAFLPCCGALALALAAWLALRDVRSADPKWSPALAVLFWSRVWCLLYRVPFAFELALLHNEGASTPRAPKASEQAFFADSDAAPDRIYPLGDTTIAKGPSVGAGQVLRTNVESLWTKVPSWLSPIVTAPEVVDLALPGYERQATWASVQIAKQSLAQAGGDLNEAARVYNGGPNYNDDAIAYATRADAFREAIS